MAKIVLTLNDTYLNEYPLVKARTSIGRRPSNDIRLDNLAVSGEHAVIVKMGSDYFVEDLDSTNGTLVNGEVAKKHVLQHDDIIELGKYQLKYVNDAAGTDSVTPTFEKTMAISPSMLASIKSHPMGAGLAAAQKPITAKVPPVTPSMLPPAGNDTAMMGRLQVLNGSSSGRELVLNKTMTTLGKTGVQVAVITKRPHGYFITHVEGKALPTVNGVPTGVQAFALNDHDVVELAGIKMKFYLTNS